MTSLQVKRPASSSNKTRLTASFARNADVVVKTTTTPTVTLPTLTVKAGENILTADKDYNVVYTSNAENVATLSGNTITINSLGIATITATVTPKDANTYEGTTATYQLSVKAPSPLNVSVMDVTINTTDAEEEQPVIKVYGDNDKLLKLNQDYTLSYTVSGDNVTVDETTGKFSVTKMLKTQHLLREHLSLPLLRLQHHHLEAIILQVLFSSLTRYQKVRSSLFSWNHSMASPSICSQARVKPLQFL